MDVGIREQPATRSLVIHMYLSTPEYTCFHMPMHTSRHAYTHALINIFSVMVDTKEVSPILYIAHNMETFLFTQENENAL